MNDYHFVFDTNTVVSALLLRESVSRQAFDLAHHLGKLILSLDTIAETSPFDSIITGDKDLLVLNPFRGIPILTPKAFLSYPWIEHLA